MPVNKGVGDAVIGGTVNRSGLVLVLAQGVGADSMLAKVVRLIEDAQVAKAPIQAYADKAGPFTRTAFHYSTTFSAQLGSRCVDYL